MSPKRALQVLEPMTADEAGKMLARYDDVAYKGGSRDSLREALLGVAHHSARAEAAEEALTLEMKAACAARDDGLEAWAHHDKQKSRAQAAESERDRLESILRDAVTSEASSWARDMAAARENAEATALLLKEAESERDSLKAEVQRIWLATLEQGAQLAIAAEMIPALKAEVERLRKAYTSEAAYALVKQLVDTGTYFDSFNGDVSVDGCTCDFCKAVRAFRAALAAAKEAGIE